MSAQQLWHTPATTELRSAAMSNEPEKLSITARYSMISQGTEMLVKKARVPQDMHHMMSVPYMLGSFDLPIHYGYAMIGEVTSGADNWVGRNIHCMHPHATNFGINAEDVMALDSNIQAQHALIGNIETAINAIWDSKIESGNKILILGLGSIGMLVGALAEKLFDVDIYFQETNPHRAECAEKKGWKSVAKDPVDVAFHTTGKEEGLQTAIEAVGLEGKVIELSWYGNKAVSLQLGGSFHTMRKQIISSQVSNIPADKAGQWDFARRRKWAMELSTELDLPDPELISLSKAVEWFNGHWQSDASFLIIDYSL